jgi:hypothetical protein
MHTCEGSEVLKPLVMKSSILSDTTLCSPLKINRRLGGLANSSITKMEATCEGEGEGTAVPVLN